MFLTDDRIKEIKDSFEELGVNVTDEFVKHFFDYTEDELKQIEKYLLPA